MKTVSKIRHYKVNPDGTLRLVGVTEREVVETHWGHIESLDVRDAADERRLAHAQEDFERLVDDACGE